MNRNRLLFIQIQALPLSMHHTRWDKLVKKHEKEPIQNHKGMNLINSPDTKPHSVKGYFYNDYKYVSPLAYQSLQTIAMVGY